MSKSAISKTSHIPAGVIMDFGGTSAPAGFVACDGSAISRTIYADLFANIGTTWGVGDGSTTFNVPDLRGMFTRGTGTHGSLTMADSNAYAGQSVGSSENDQMQGHRHGMRGSANVTAGGVTIMDQNGSGETTLDPVTDTVNGTPRTGDETRPVNYGVLKIIKF
jgi:microcystin-dependent protein